MAVRAGTGFIDILPRVSHTAFAGAINAQVKPAITSLTAGLKQSFAPLAPIIAGTAAVAIGRLTLDFENAFTRIAAISNATAAQINTWRDAVFELGQETAIAPQRLADGLFFLASAGLDANQIFPALEASAKGAAIGLGEMEDITRTVAQVLNAYPDAGLKAIDVVDNLTAAVRESTAEPEEFATALGRILPIASKAEVGIEELTASLATLSNIGLDVDEGVTGVRQVLNLIVSPGKQAAETMNELGISTESLRQRLADKGIINTLRFLNEKVGESEDKFRKLLPNIRAMTAAFGLTEQEAAKVDGIFQRVANSSGDLNEALTETQAGPGFKFQQLMVSLQEAATRLGQAILPVAVLIAQAFIAILGPVADLLGLLGEIPGVVTAAAVAFGAFKILPILAGWLGKLTTLFVANRVALQAQAIAATEAAAAQSFLTAAQASGAAVTLKMSQASTAAAASGTVAATAGRGLGAAIGALITPTSVAAAGIGLIAFGMKQAADDAKNLEAATESLANRLLSGDLSERGVREIFRDEDIPEFAQSKFDAFARGVIQRSNELRAAQARVNDFVVRQSGIIREVMAPTFTEGAEILDSMGTSATAFSEAAVRALRAGDDAFKKFSEGAIGDAAKLIDDFHDSASENLNFTAAALGELSSAATSAQEELATADLSMMDADDIANLRAAADLTAGELLKSFKDARRETEAFGKDLLVISRTGGEAGDRLAEVLLGMGDAGQAAADTIANAGPKMRDALIRNFAAGEGAAENLATRLTRRIVGTLNDIKEILEDIARAWDVRLNLEGGEPVGRTLTNVRDRLFEIDGYTATAHVTTVFTREGGPAPPEDPTRVDFRAEGGVIGAQHGGITRRPTVIAGEGRGHTPFGRGAEGILPLDDHTMGRLGRAVARQIEMPTVIVKVGEEEIARTISRGQRRRRSLVGA